MNKIYIIIPTYNEARNIVKVIQDIKGENPEYNVVVVDDGSEDSTVELAEEQSVTVLRHIINRGQGAALKTGTEYAISKGADVLVHFDADGQFVVSEIKDVVAPIVSGEADIVFGSRFLSARGGKKPNMPWLKRCIMMPLARFINWWFFDIKLTDPQSGFRALSGETAQKINWQQDRMAHCSEIMHQAFEKELRIKEVAVTVIYRDFGQRFSGGVKILKEMFIGSFTK